MAVESSRIFVRGLPPKFTEEDVRNHFSAKGTVTDVKFFPKRRIGYVGYRTPQDASGAVKYFDKSFIRMARINVEIARPFNDRDLPKSRRQQKQEKDGPRHDDYVPPPQENPLKRKREEAAQDPRLKEFLEVMQPPSKKNIWANDENVDHTAELPADAVEEVTMPEGESDDEYQVITKKTKPSATIETTAQMEATGMADADEEEQMIDLADLPPMDNSLVSDVDWLRSRTNRTLDIVEDGVDAHPPESQPLKDSSEATADQIQISNQGDDVEDVSASEEDKIRQTGRLYLRNLHYDVTDDDIRAHFGKYPSLEEVHVPSKKADGKAKGFAFLSFQDPEAAVQAFLENDGRIFQGRLLHILGAQSKRDSKLDEFAISKLPLKKQKEIRRKAEAGRTAFNWNSLYVSADAVMSTVADRMGISKAELLDPSSSDAAVKQALAETKILQEIKEYFAQHGVDLEAFRQSKKGDLAILVKNIPHETSSDELRKLFEEHGTIERFLFPPTGMTAIVAFSNAAQAKSAFMSLSYRKLKDSILYLEKAPHSLFKKGVVVPNISQTTTINSSAAKLSAKDLLEEAAEPEVTNTATLYVRNLNFSTTTEGLRRTFSPLSGYRTANVKTKVDPKRGVLSMGFGFVEFSNPETASSAMRTMDGYMLDGHQLRVQLSNKGADPAEERRKEDATKKTAGTKIIIKNLPFEASKKDVRALFGPYGTLRSVRVPKKFEGSSRGFGFAEFTTKRDAVSAMNALRNTHLLGRRLVLAFAETETDDPEKELEKMQQKVGAQANKVALQRLTAGGRKKFNVAGNDDLDEA